ncbi:MAG TPA: hypothetical protein VGR00_08740 [Thermoanaerobaculia bacterium]|nr:hypothetical protein [Thermoanaerobaculia bacterium]
MSGRGASRALSLVFAALLAWGLFGAALVATRQPASGGDYVAIWGVKARALARTGSLASLVRIDPSGMASHPEYPPLWPLLLAGFSNLLGRYDDLFVTPLWPVLLLVGAALVSLATKSERPFRLLGAAVFALLPYFRTPLYVGYAEALLLVFLLAALREARRLSEGRWATFRLAALLVLAALTKQEGIFAAAVFAVLLFLSGRRKESLVSAGAVLAIGVLPWNLWLRFADAEPIRRDFALASFDPSHGLAAARALLKIAVVPNVGWIVGGALLLFLAKETRRRRRFELAGAVLYSLGLVQAFAFTTLDPVWHVRWTWDRLALVPIALLVPTLAEAAEEVLRPRQAPAESAPA